MFGACRSGWLGFAFAIGGALCACGDSGAVEEGDTSADAGSDAGAEDAGQACAPGTVQSANGCVDPLRRYEPAKRIDFDNVVGYGRPVSLLDLPDPPKSGFRLVVTPKDLPAGYEVQECHAWAFPNIENHYIYAARLYTTSGLHHSNVFGVPLASSGPSPYPDCNPGQGEVETQVPNLLAGNIMDVLFANSTQVRNGEQIVFPDGMAFKLTTDGREVAASIHWLNATENSVTSEIVYDFFTMKEALVKTEIVPFVFEPEEFSIPAGTTGDVTSTCDLKEAGNIVTIMPHTHKRATNFLVELLGDEGKRRVIFEDGAFDTDSDIEVFPKAIPTDGFNKIRHTCTIRNDLDKPIVWGIGDNEMCTLFGYLYPPSAQQLGYTAKGTTECLSLDLGALRH